MPTALPWSYTLHAFTMFKGHTAPYEHYFVSIQSKNIHIPLYFLEGFFSAHSPGSSLQPCQAMGDFSAWNYVRKALPSAEVTRSRSQSKSYSEPWKGSGCVYFPPTEENYMLKPLSRWWRIPRGGEEDMTVSMSWIELTYNP